MARQLAAAGARLTLQEQMEEAKALLQNPVMALPKLGEEQLKAGQNHFQKSKKKFALAFMCSFGGFHGAGVLMGKPNFLNLRNLVYILYLRFLLLVLCGIQWFDSPALVAGW